MKSSHGYAPNDMETQALLLLARLGRLLSRHLHVAWGSSCSIQNVNLSLRKLTAAGLISFVEHYEAHGRRKGEPYHPWKRHGRIYSLTPAGWEYLNQAFPTLEETHERLAPTYFNPRHQAEHQIEYGDLITSVIRALGTIPGIIGISSYIEMDLGPDARPRADGILIMRRWSNATLPHLEQSSLYPWLLMPRQNHQIDRTFAIEIDRGTEEIAVLQGKAESYAAVFQSGYWKNKYQWPIVAFAVPTESRKQKILDAWERGWPRSMAIATTFAAIHDQGVLASIWTLQRTVNGQRTHEPYSFIPSAWRTQIVGESA